MCIICFLEHIFFSCHPNKTKKKELQQKPKEKKMNLKKNRSDTINGRTIFLDSVSYTRPHTKGNKKIYIYWLREENFIYGYTYSTKSINKYKNIS